MRVLMVVVSYWPRVGGVEVHVQHVAEGMASHGHQVTVLTSRHHSSLPLRESIAGVDIVRAPVLGTVARIPVMPSFIPHAAALMRQADVVAVHIPLAEAGLVCRLARRLGRPVVLSYYCDFEPRSGRWSWLGPKTLGAMNSLAARCADFIIVASRDYADGSALLKRFESKLRVVTPLANVGPAPGRTVERAGRGNQPGAGPVIAMAARMAPEKGVEYLLDAIPHLLPRYPELVVTMTGERRGDIGCESYFRHLEPMIDRYSDHIRFVGALDRSEMPSFFVTADVLVVPSVDAREAFGMVQVEAMLCGTPVVASNLPGMREPVARTGMGVLVPTRDPRALAEGIRSVLENRPQYERRRSEIEQIFDAGQALDAYEELLQAALNRGSG
jgi:glycosyltransferase involved in cell wall biosynthesis